MSDYSSFALFTAGLAVFAPLVSAQGDAIKVPGGSNPTGPALYQPNLNVVVPAGTQFSITWATGTEESCGKKVDLVLLKGPSSNAMNPLRYIAKGVENTGNYAWKPATDLEPSPTDYGIELVCSKDQAYQYTPRFGISNDKYVPGGDKDKTTSAPSPYPGATTTPGSPYSAPTTSSSANATSTTTSSDQPKYPVGTGGGNYGNATEPRPTGSFTAPSSLPTTTPPATTPTPPVPGPPEPTPTPSRLSTGAAAIQTGVSGLLAAAAIAAIAL